MYDTLRYCLAYLAMYIVYVSTSYGIGLQNHSDVKSFFRLSKLDRSADWLSVSSDGRRDRDYRDSDSERIPLPNHS